MYSALHRIHAFDVALPSGAETSHPHWRPDNEDVAAFDFGQDVRLLVASALVGICAGFDAEIHQSQHFAVHLFGLQQPHRFLN